MKRRRREEEEEEPSSSKLEIIDTGTVLSITVHPLGTTAPVLLEVQFEDLLSSALLCQHCSPLLRNHREENLRLKIILSSRAIITTMYACS